MAEPFLVFDRDPATGARPGLVQGETYTTNKEVERNKYEVLEAYSATHLKELEAAQADPDEEEEEEPEDEEQEAMASELPPVLEG